MKERVCPIQHMYKSPGWLYAPDKFENPMLFHPLLLAKECKGTMRIRYDKIENVIL